MTKRRRILHADRILRNVMHFFCLLMFLQLKGFYTLTSNPVLLYSTASDLRTANITKTSKVNTIIKNLKSGSAVDFLYRRSLVCWSDHTEESIQCMKYYGGTHTENKEGIVTDGLITPTGLAIDWYTDKIYWTDGETNRIEVISIDQKYRKVLFWSDVDLARAIAVVPKDGLLFWTDWGEVPKIERAGMNGDPSTRKILVKDNILWPNGITVDYNNNLIYWVDANLKFIDMIDFNGEKRKRIVKVGLEYPYALTFFDNKLYWTDWKNWSIYSWDITTNGPIKELIKSNPVPIDIKLFDSSRQILPEGDYPCKVNNGGCSHLCLISPVAPGYNCSCPTGVKLIEGSNSTCYDSPQSLLIVAQRSMISKISLDSPDFTPVTLPLKDLKRALSVDFDPKTEFIYWSDTLAKTISRSRLDGSEQTVVLHNIGVPDSIAIDPLARNIYWSDPVSDTITVSKLDGSARKVIVYEELYDPRAIALHPTAGLMFWSDWNDKKPKIERANLDGSNRKIIVFEKVTWPNGIALDTVNDRLYWGDAKTHKIETCDLDGLHRRELHSHDIIHIFGLALLGDYIYWTDIQKRSLDRINRSTGTERQPIAEQMANMMGLKALRLGEPLGTNPCVQNNGGCSHLCFNRPQDYICSCPLVLELASDRKTCIEPTAFLLYGRKNMTGTISIENENDDAVLPIRDIKEVNALALHIPETKLYWSDSKLKTINRCSIDGSNVEKILDWAGFVEGLAIDYSGQNIYWTDTATQRIEVCRLDGSSRRSLIWQGLKKPKSIVLESKSGYMYWSELGSKSIKRSSMDGSSIINLIEQVGRVHALAIDNAMHAIYWASLDPPTIEYAYLNGTGRKLLIDNVVMPYALTIYGDRVYWGDWHTGLVESASKIDGSNRKVIHKNLDYISELKVYHKGKIGGGNQCEVDNGGCSQLCLPVPGDYKCACAAHYRLEKDNVTCSEPEEYLLFAQKNALGRIMIANGECNDAFIPLSGLKSVRAIEYDPINKQFYWMDDDSRTIRRVEISHSPRSAISDSVVVINNVCKPFHMVLDVLGRTLYWTCLDTDSINVTSIDKNVSMDVLVRVEKMMPRHLAFHQTKRFLVWNDVGYGSLIRSNVDGTNTLELVRTSNVTALTVDQNSNTVYWAVNRQIHAVDLDATNKRIIWQGGFAGALSAYSGALYFGGGERGLMRVPLHRRDAPATPVPHISKLSALITVHKVSTSHACYQSACGVAGCGVDGACGCGVNCAHAVCPPRHIACSLGAPPAGPAAPPAPAAQCVPAHYRCDGQADCADGSDEAGCACGGGVRCRDDACADSVAACATGARCPRPAPPPPDAFRCDENLCLGTHLLCDGHPHCDDGTDESPTACEVQKDPVYSSGGGHVWAGVGCAAGAALAAGVAWWVRRRCRPAPRPAPRLLAPLVPRAPCPAALQLPPSPDPLTSDESFAWYPRPTANPPPSPATASAGRRRAPRHYRAATRPPPPTPASTDAADSEPEPAGRAPPPSPAPFVF